MKPLHAGRAIHPRPETKAAAKRAARFNKTILDFARSIGATEEEHILPSVILDTIFGPMRITPLGTWLACRFCDDAGLARAAAALNCRGWQRVNPYSGKYNCHPDGTTEERIEEAIRHIKSVAKETPT